MKKTIYLSGLLILGLMFTGCQSNKDIQVTRTGVITKVENKVMNITLNTGMKIKLASVNGTEEVGDTINLEVR